MGVQAYYSCVTEGRSRAETQSRAERKEHTRQKLLDEVRDLPRMGYIRTPGRIGWDIRFARHVADPDGGERIILVTDRHMSFREAAFRPRSFDYPFTVIELRLTKEGDGEGKMTLATRIFGDSDKRVVTLENYDIQPVMLTKVTRESVTH